MRTTRIAVWVSTVLLAAGAIAAGCVDSNGTSPGSDAGGFTFDAGSFDSALPDIDATILDGASPVVDAAIDVQVSTATIDFGRVSCGTGTASQSYSLTNTTSVPITYSASVPSGSVFSITSGASATVAPGAVGTLALAASGIPTTSVAGTPITSTLTVTTDLPGVGPFSVPLSVTPQGGSITVSPSPAAFGQVQLAYGATPIPLTIANTGNAPVTLSFGPPTEADGGIDTAYGLTYPGAGPDASVTIPAGGTLGDAGATFAPTTPTTDAVTFAIRTSDPLCASPATAVTMTGTGTTAQITVGPTPLQFGIIPCGDAGAPLQVTIMNSSPNPVTFTASLGLGAASPFTIDFADGGTVPGFNGTPGTTKITVTPKTITAPASIDAGAFDDTLLVTPNTPFVAATPIALQESAEGAILAVKVADGGAFGTVVSPEGTLAVQVINTGNMSAVVNLNPNPGVVDGGVFFGSQVTAPPDGGPANTVVEYQPNASQVVSSSLVVATPAPLCSVPAAPIPLTATGALAVAGFATTPIALTSTCGGTGAQGALNIANTGQGTLRIESASSTSGKFTIVSALPLTIAPSSNANLVIAAVAVGQGTAAGTVIDDTLSFTTNEVSTQTEPRTVPVAVTLIGANLSFVGGNTLDITSCGSGSFTVQNTGNMDATVLGAGSYPTDSPFTFSGTFSASGTPIVTAGGGTQSDSASVNFCAGTTPPCSLSAPPQPFDSTTPTDAGSSAVGICIPLPALNVSVNLPDPSESCQQQCCG